MDKLAIIQSVYRGDKPDYLKDSVSSILSQSYGSFKYYIGIDGPIGDPLREILVGFTDDRIEIVDNKENRGLANTLNDLLAMCRKDEVGYIARMDSDDVARPYRLEKQLSFLKANRNIDMIGGAINEIDENGEDRGKVVRYPCNPEECRKFFAKRNPVAHPAVMFRRNFFDNTGWKYPTDYVRNEDTRLWHEGYLHGCTISNIPDIVLDYRITNSFFTERRNGREFAKNQLSLRKMIKKDLGYGFMASFYAYATYLLMIAPSYILKAAYKIFR